MWSFVFIFFIVPIVTGLTIDIARGRFRRRTSLTRLSSPRLETHQRSWMKRLSSRCCRHAMSTGNRSQRPGNGKGQGLMGRSNVP